jgi:DNA modification methylase
MEIAILALADIVIKPERQRQDFNKEAMLELGKRIKEHGLLHPPGISTVETKTLVYGERRVRILKFLSDNGIAIRFNNETLPLGFAPFVVSGTDDEVELEKIELAENSARSDLTWQEQTKAVARIEALIAKRMQREAPELILESIKVPVALVAEQAQLSKRITVDEINIAQHMDDPDVMKAKTKKDALKVIAKKKTQEFRAKAAKDVKATSKDHFIAQGDCRELIKQVPNDSIRSIVTDPPYGIDMHKDQSWDGTWHEYNDTEAYCFNLIEQLLPEWDRVTHTQAHLFLFCDFDKFNKLRAIVEGQRVTKSGEVIVIPMDDMIDLQLGRTGRSDALYAASKPIFEVMYFPFIWNKGNVASYPRPDHWPRKSYECLLFAIKGGLENQSGKLDLAVIDIPQLQNQDHPAGKPLDLYERLVLRSSLAGDAILDCFAGQGNLLRACRKNNRRSVSFELSDTYFPLLSAAYNEEIKND